MSSKRLAIKFKPKLVSKQWQQRVQVTGESLCLLFKHRSGMWKKRMAALRRPLDKATFEEGILIAAFCQNSADGITDMHPALAEKLRLNFVEAWAEGDPHIDVELRSAWAEKSEGFKVAEISVLKELLDSRVGHTVPSIAAKENHLMVVAPKIQQAGCERALGNDCL